MQTTKISNTSNLENALATLISTLAQATKENREEAKRQTGASRQLLGGQRKLAEDQEKFCLKQEAFQRKGIAEDSARSNADGPLKKKTQESGDKPKA